MAHEILAAEGAQKEIRLWTKTAEVEPQAIAQLKSTASLPWVFKHVAAMPDVHFGFGATVGSVVAMKGAVCPAAVGVDIGCGMAALQTSLKAEDLPDNLFDIRHDIERSIPVGFNHHKTDGEAAVEKYEETKHAALTLFDRFPRLHSGVQKLVTRAIYQCGTLGGGDVHQLAVDPAPERRRGVQQGVAVGGEARGRVDRRVSQNFSGKNLGGIDVVRMQGSR